MPRRVAESRTSLFPSGRAANAWAYAREQVEGLEDTPGSYEVQGCGCHECDGLYDFLSVAQGAPVYRNGSGWVLHRERATWLNTRVGAWVRCRSWKRLEKRQGY